MADGSVNIKVNVDGKEIQGLDKSLLKTSQTADKAGQSLDGVFQDKKGRWREANGRFMSMQRQVDLFGKEAVAATGKTSKLGSVLSKIGSGFNLGSLKGQFGGVSSALDGVKTKALSAVDAFKGFALAQAAVQVAGKAINSLKGSVDGAVARIDTLNNSDRTFANMGFSAEDTSKAMDGLKTSIQGLPTPLDQAVSGMQLIASSTGDVGKSQQVWSALNDGILGFGGSTEQVNNAVTQLSQAFSNGKVDAETWNSMIDSGLGPALNAIAKDMGLTAGQLKDGLSDGSISVAQFQDALVKLDQQGGGGLKSLNQIAKDSTSGISTSIANMKTAITRGVADVIKSFDNFSKSVVGFGIADAFNKAGSIVEGQLKKISQALDATAPKAKQFTDNIKTALSSLKSGNGTDAFMVLAQSATAGLDSLTNMVTGGLSKVNVKIVGFLTGLTSYLPQINSFASTLGASVQSGLSSVVSSIGTIAANLTQVFAKILPSLITVGSGLIGGLIDGIAGAAPQLLTAMGNGIALAISGISQNLPSLAETGVGLINGIIVGLTNALPTIATAILKALPLLVQAAATLVVGLISGISEHIGELTVIGAQILSEIVVAIVQSLPTLIQSSGQIITAIITGIAAAIPLLIQKGPEIINALITGINQSLPAIGEAMKDAMSSILNSIHDAFANADTGNAMFDGILHSIADFAGSLSGFISNLDNVKVGMASLAIISGGLLLKLTPIGKIVSALTPSFGSLGGGLSKLLPSFSSLTGVLSKITPLFSSMGSGFLNFGTTLGTSVFGGITKVIQPLTNLLTSTKLGSTAVPIFGQVFNALSGPLGIATLALGGITAALAATGPHFDAIMLKVQQFGQNFTATAPIVGTAFGQIIGGILTALGNAIPQMAIGIANLMNGLVQGIIIAGPSVIAAMVTVIGFIGQAILTTLPEIISYAGQIITAFLNGIAEQLPAIMDAGAKLIVNFLEGLNDHIGDITTKALEVMTTFLTALASKIGDVVNAGMKVIINFISGMIPHIGELAAKGVELIAKLLEGIASKAGDLVEAGLQIVINLLNGIAKKADDLVKAAFNIVISILNGISKKIDDLIQAGVGIVVAIINGIGNSINDIVEAANRLMMQVVQAIIDNTNNVADAMIKLLNGLAETIKKKAPKIKKAAKKLMDAILDAIPGGGLIKNGLALIDGLIGGMKKAWNAGKKFIEGIAGWIADHKGPISYDKRLLIPAGNAIMSGLNNGLVSSFGVVTDTVSNLTDVIKSGITDPLGIHSPSTVTAGYGENVGQGMANGIDASAQNAEQAAKDMADAIMKQLDFTKASFDFNPLQNGQAYLNQLNQAMNTANLGADNYNKILTEIYNTQTKIADESVKWADTMHEIGQLNVYQYESKLNDILKMPMASDEYRTVLEKISKAHAEAMTYEIDRATKAFDTGKRSAQDYINALKGLEGSPWATEDNYWDLESKILKVQQDQVTEALKNAANAYQTAKLSGDDYIDTLRNISKMAGVTHDNLRDIDKTIYDTAETMRKAAVENQKNFDKLHTDILKAQETFVDKMADINDKMVDSITQAQEQYQQKLSQLKDTVYNQMALFDAPSKILKVHSDTLIKRLQQQVDIMANWQKNMGQLDQILPKEMADEIRAMGVKEAGRVEAITKMTGSQLDEYVALWRKKNQQAASEANIQAAPDRQALATQIQGIIADSQQQLETARKDWENTLYGFKDTLTNLTPEYQANALNVGVSTVQGIINGLNSLRPELQSTAQQIASTITNTIQQQLQIHSPSKVMASLGQFAGQGLGNGLANMIDFVAAKAKLLGNAVMPNNLGADLSNIKGIRPEAAMNLKRFGAGSALQTINNNKRTVNEGDVVINMYADIASDQDMRQISKELGQLVYRERKGGLA